MKAALTVLFLAATGTVAAQTPGDWPAYGRDAGGTRYSPLDRITRANVTELKVAWVYRTGDYLRDRGRFEATPLVVDGSLYVSTPLGGVIALDPATGAERWRYDARISLEGDYGDFASRPAAASRFSSHSTTPSGSAAAASPRPASSGIAASCSRETST